MKKKTAAAVLASAVMIMSTACTAGKISMGPPDLQICGAYDSDFTMTAYITPPDSEKGEEDELCLSGHISRLGGGFWNMSISAPETLSGLEVSAADDVISSNLGELSFDLPVEKMPKASPLTALFSVLDGAATLTENGALPESGEDGGWVLTGDGYTIIFDSNGAPVSMACANPKITVEFTAFVTVNIDSGNVTSEVTSESTSPESTDATENITSAPVITTLPAVTSQSISETSPTAITTVVTSESVSETVITAETTSAPALTTAPESEATAVSS